MLHVVRGTDPIEVKTITALIYGDPGAGKTSLASTAATPLLLDFDRGAHRSAFRGDSVQIEQWSDVANMSAADLASYSTVIVDTVGRCVDAMATEIISENAKMASGAGQLSLQGWGALKGRFAAWMRQVRSYGKDVILVAHGLEQRKGDDILLRPDIAGGSYSEVFKLADGIAHLQMRGSRRYLSWSPQERAVGKNPAQLADREVPHLSQEPRYLADLIAQIKDSIGQISEASSRVREVVDAWREKVETAKDAKALTKLVAAVNGELEGPALPQVKALIARRAKDEGLKWAGDKFVAREEEMATAEAAAS